MPHASNPENRANRKKAPGPGLTACVRPSVKERRLGKKRRAHAVPSDRVESAKKIRSQSKKKGARGARRPTPGHPP